MTKAKTVIVTSEQTSSWVSCQVISPNLIKSYQKFIPQDELVILDYKKSHGRYEVIDLGHTIFDLRPKKLIFVDHAPHPIKLLQILDYLYQDHERPELYFHVFGDFALYAKDWFDLNDILKKFRTTFFAASERQQKLIQSFCENFSENVLYCPFPVDESKYFFNSDLRTKIRSQLNILENEYVFIYTGRLSEQKNILGLTKAFKQFLEKTGIQARLYLAGEFDDLGIPYIGARRLTNFMFQLWKKEYSKYPKSIQDKILYLGNLGESELKDLYHAGDCFVSMSTHNDEDFGMSPAEALMTGSQAILSDWAGYASFSDTTKHTSLVPVNLNQEKLQVDYNSLFKELLKKTTFKPNDQLRTEAANHYKARFGVYAISKLLEAQHRRSTTYFTSFSKQLNLMRKSLLASPNAPFLLQTPSYNQTYGNIYAPYFRTPEDDR